MKLKHTIKRDGCTLSGQIIETIFEGDEKRGDRKDIQVGSFTFVSSVEPELIDESLYVHGYREYWDTQFVQWTYSSEREAQAMLDAINFITIVDTPTPLEEKWVYVSDKSEGDAIESTDKKLLLADLWDKYLSRYITTAGLKSWTSWQYAVPVPKSSPKKLRQVEMTDEEYEKFINQSTND